MKKIFFLLITFFLLVGCDEKPRIRKDVKYPDLISPIYFLETINISSPRVALVDGTLYIFSLDCLESFDTKEEFIEQECVLPYSDVNILMYSVYNEIYDIHNSKKSLYNFDFIINSNYWNYELFIPENNNNKVVAIYKFAFEPETFFLLLTGVTTSLKYMYSDLNISYITEEDHKNSLNKEYEYKKDYSLSLLPKYRKRDMKMIDQIIDKYPSNSGYYLMYKNNEYLELKKNRDSALEIALNDFLECDLSKTHNIFFVGFDDEVTLNDDVSAILVIPSYFTYHITLNDTIGSNELPTRFLLKNDKLFYWYDPNYGLTEDLVDAFYSFNIIDTIDVGFNCNFREKYENPKFAVYFFCKDDLNNYKRVIKNNYPKRSRWYRNPKIKCKK